MVNDEAGATGALKAVAFNKHADRAVRLATEVLGGARMASVLRLGAPRLDDTQDVTLGANPVGANGFWNMARVDWVDVLDGMATIEMPAGSAALVSFHE